MIILLLITIWPLLEARSVSDKENLFGLTAFQLKSVISIGRCRARCMDKFAKYMEFVTDEACTGHPDCFMCWDNCFRMDQDWETWGVMCGHDDICFTGCQVACDHFEKLGLARAPSTRSWDFSKPVQIDRQVRDSYIKASWDAPTTSDLNPPHVIYALFWRSKDENDWVPLQQTVERHYSTNDGSLVLDLEDFKVIAVSGERIIGAINFWQPPTTTTSTTTEPSPRIVEIFEQPDGRLSMTMLLGLTLFVSIAVGLLAAGGLTAAYFVYQRKKRENVVLRGRHFAFRMRQPNFRESLKRSVRCKTQPQKSVSNTNLLRINNSPEKLAFPGVHGYSPVKAFSPEKSPDRLFVNSGFTPSRPNSASPAGSQTQSGPAENRRKSQDSAIIAIIEGNGGHDTVKINHDLVKKALAAQKSYAL